MNSRGCMTQTTVSGRGPAGWYSDPEVAAPSAVRSTTLRVEAPAGRSRGFQSVLRKPAVIWLEGAAVVTFVSCCEVLWTSV